MTSGSTSPAAREAARARIEARRGFIRFAVGTLAMNVFLVIVWALTGAGFFWPGFVIASSLLALGTRWMALRAGPVSEADVDAELAREQR